MPTWLVVIVTFFLLGGGPQLVLWVIRVRLFINKPQGKYRSIPGRSGKEILLLGDSIGTGYGASRNETTLWGLISVRFMCGVEVLTRPFEGIAAIPKLLRQRRGSQYNAIILSAGGNDALFFLYPSLRKIERNLRETIKLARSMTENLVILGNFDALGSVYPVWWLRLLFGLRGEQIRKIYERVCDEQHVCMVDIGDILTDKRNLARDKVHPNDRAFEEIIDRIRGRLNLFLK